jgi:hypothetical protein
MIGIDALASPRSQRLGHGYRFDKTDQADQQCGYQQSLP